MIAISIAAFIGAVEWPWRSGTLGRVRLLECPTEEEARLIDAGAFSGDLAVAIMTHS